MKLATQSCSLECECTCHTFPEVAWAQLQVFSFCCFLYISLCFQFVPVFKSSKLTLLHLIMTFSLWGLVHVFQSYAHFSKFFYIHIEKICGWNSFYSFQVIVLIVFMVYHVSCNKVGIGGILITISDSSWFIDRWKNGNRLHEIALVVTLLLLHKTMIERLVKRSKQKCWKLKTTF